MYIQITENVKVKSPLDRSDLYSYEGPIEEVNFLQQKKNYDKIQEILSEYDMKLVYVMFAKFSRDSSSSYHFLARSENSRVFWRKYEGESHGSGQNYIYIDGEQYKLTYFLKMTKEERDDIFF